MDYYESFYAQEWVQVTTAFVYLIFILFVPFLYWKISTKLSGETRRNFIDCASDIYIAVFLLLLAPIGYLILYFMGSEKNFMLNDPLPWVCLFGSASAIFDLVRSKYKLQTAKKNSKSKQRLTLVIGLNKIVKLAFCLSLIPLTYGIVMIAVTNLVDTKTLNSVLWFITFLMTGWAVSYTAAAKSILFVSQAYAVNSKLGEDYL